jgi:endonuclease III related protein
MVQAALSTRVPLEPLRKDRSEFALPSPSTLQQYFQTLSTALGPMKWWPAKTPFEVIVGAILTQSTAWVNVEQALTNLRREGLLKPSRMEQISEPRLARLIRPSGYFRQKAKKLKAFVGFLRRRHGGSLARMFRTPTLELREQLLGVHGIGPETADSILLYAGGHAVFVIDAYTHRILGRHRLSSGKPHYDSAQAFFTNNLPQDAALYNEFHALLVNVGKNWCRKGNPRCEDCPLLPYLPGSPGPLEARA